MTNVAKPHWQYGYIKDGKKIIDPLLHYGCFVLGFQRDDILDYVFNNIKIKPEIGKLILFPPFWTHEHRGVTLKKGVKYIATTWIVFK